MKGTVRFGIAHVENFPELGPYLHAEQRIVAPAFRFPDVAVFGDDVVVTAEHKCFLQGEQALGVAFQVVHPAQLVVVFLGVHRIAVGQVNRCDADHLAVDIRHRLDITGLFVTFIAGQAGGYILERRARQDGDPVIGFLARDRDRVAGILDLHPGKVFLDAFQFL